MRERNIWFLLFEIKRVFVYNSTVFRLTGLYVNTFSFKMYMPTKKYFKNKGSNCDLKSQLSEILTEPLNPRGTNKGDIGKERTTKIVCLINKK